MRIDMHAHYYPNEYLDLMVGFGSSRDHADRVRVLNAGGSDEAIAERLAVMDALGIDVQVISASSHASYFEDRENTVTAARFANDAYAQLVRDHPRRFVALGTVPLPHVAQAVDELARCMDDLGMPGVAIASSICGRGVAEKTFEPFYAEMDRRGALLLLHPAMVGGLCPLINDYQLQGVVGWAVEDAIALLQLMRAGILTRYPHIRVVSVHLGGFVPFVMHRLDNAFRRVAPDLELPSQIVRRVWFDTATNAHPAALRCFADMIGTDRLVYGTDFPYHKVQSLSVEAELLSGSFAPLEMKAIFEDNAIQAFGQSFELNAFA